MLCESMHGNIATFGSKGCPRVLVAFGCALLRACPLLAVRACVALRVGRTQTFATLGSKRRPRVLATFGGAVLRACPLIAARAGVALRVGRLRTFGGAVLRACPLLRARAGVGLRDGRSEADSRGFGAEPFQD